MLNFLFRKKKDEETFEHFEDVEEPAEKKTTVVDEQFSQISNTLSQITSTIRSIEQRTRDAMEKIETIEEKLNVHEKEIEQLKNTSEKMFMLYDMISRNYNPFIEEESTSKQIIVEGGKNVEELESAPPTEEILPLDKISRDPSFIAVVMGWLNYLVTKSNVRETEKAIEYYESIGWITENVKIELLKYLNGFKNIECENLELTPEDHLVSLYIITKLKDGLDRGIVKFSELYREMIDRGIIKPVR